MGTDAATQTEEQPARANARTLEVEEELPDFDADEEKEPMTVVQAHPANTLAEGDQQEGRQAPAEEQEVKDRDQETEQEQHPSLSTVKSLKLTMVLNIFILMSVELTLTLLTTALI